MLWWAGVEARQDKERGKSGPGGHLAEAQLSLGRLSWAAVARMVCG